MKNLMILALSLLFVGEVCASHEVQRIVVRPQRVQQVVVRQRVQRVIVRPQQAFYQPVRVQQIIAPVYTQQVIAPVYTQPVQAPVYTQPVQADTQCNCAQQIQIQPQVAYQTSCYTQGFTAPQAYSLPLAVNSFYRPYGFALQAGPVQLRIR